jgi:hypothetical protein
MRHTALLQGLLTLHFHNSSLIRNSRNKLVVNKHNRVKFDTTLDDKVCNTSSISKGRDVPSNLVEGDAIVGTIFADELTLGLVTNNGDGRVLADFCVGGKKRFGVASEGFTSSLGEGGVDTTTKTLVGGDNDEEFGGCGLVGGGVHEDL